MAKTNTEKQIEGLDAEWKALEERIDRLTESKNREIQGLTDLFNEKTATVEMLRTQIDTLEHGEETDPDKVKEILNQRLDVERDLQTAEKELEIVSDKLKKATESKAYISESEYSDIRHTIESYLKQAKDLYRELCLPDLEEIQKAGESIVTATQRANTAEKKAASLNPKVDKGWSLSRYQPYAQAQPYIETTKAFNVGGQWWASDK